MKKKILVIGDIHGDEKLVEHIITKFPDHLLVFVGDFLDSFTFSPRAQVRCIQMVLPLIQEKKAICLMGNHEASYLFPSQRATGWNEETHRLFLPLQEEVKQHFVYGYWMPKYSILISHAGLTKDLWDQFGLTKKNLFETLRTWSGNIESPLYWIGRARGGMRKTSGLLWCDWSHEFKGIPGIKQIVGHTAVKEIETDQEGNYNIDCLQTAKKGLEIDEGEIRETTL